MSSTQPTPEELDQMHRVVGYILDQAYDLFGVRNAKYKNAFVMEGAMGNSHMLRHKATRMMKKVMDYMQWLEDPMLYEDAYGRRPEKPNVDDALDLINYACFLVVCIENDIWEGEASMPQNMTSAEAAAVTAVAEWKRGFLGRFQRGQ